MAFLPALARRLERYRGELYRQTLRSRRHQAWDGFGFSGALRAQTPSPRPRPQGAGEWRGPPARRISSRTASGLRHRADQGAAHRPGLRDAWLHLESIEIGFGMGAL